MAFIDYIIDTREKKMRGPFISVVVTLWLLIYNSLVWFSCVPETVLDKVSKFSVEANATGLALIGMYWYNKYKQEQLNRYVDFAEKQNEFATSKE